MSLVIVMMIDVSLARTHDLIDKGSSFSWKLAVFILIVSVCSVSNYWIIAYAGNKDLVHVSANKSRFSAAYRTIKASQFVIIAILIAIAVQTVSALKYNNALVIATIWMSFGLAITTLGFLAYRFLSWLRSSQNNTILLFSLASIALSINIAFSLAYVTDILIDRQAEIMPAYTGSMVQILPNSLTAALSLSHFVSSIVAFGLLWGAAAALMHHFSLKFGRLRYWLIVSAPLVFFLGQFVSFFAGFFDSMQVSDPVSFVMWITLIFTLSKPFGGILFGFAFFTLAKNFRQNAMLRNYVIISAFGFVLLYASNNASDLLVSPFPPFGIASVSFVGLASHLILQGIYSSAVLISEDTKLRKFVRRFALDQSKLLDDVGTAEMEEVIQKRVLKLAKENSDKMVQETGVEIQTSDDELKRYINDVMKEIGLSADRGQTQGKDTQSKQE